MTFRVFDALTQTWRRREQRADRRAAVTAMVLANIHRGKQTPAYRLEDFLVHQWETPEAPEAPAQRTPEQEIALAKAFVRSLGGTVIERETDGPD
jgi:hypothetical protein